MGIANRIAELYRVRVNALLDRAEDPGEMLDYSAAQQQEFLGRMRSAAAEVVAARRHARAQENELRHTAGRLQAQAEQAVVAGKERLGRDALAYRAEVIAHADELAAEQGALSVEQERLTEEVRRLQARFEAFRFRKDMLKAAYPAAKPVTVAAAGSLAGMTDVAQATRLAEHQTAALQARAHALCEQIEAGGPVLLPPLDAYQIQAELDGLTTDMAVEEELARIKARMAHPARTQR
jgi:phage shock protein A